MLSDSSSANPNTDPNTNPNTNTNQVLSDSSSEAGVRQQRAKGLVVMGRIFKGYGKANAIEKSDFTRHVEDVGRKAEQMVAEARDAEDAEQ